MRQGISESNKAFALAIGGGVDIAVSSKSAIRLVDADYELTRGGNNSKSSGGQLNSSWPYPRGRGPLGRRC